MLHKHCGLNKWEIFKYTLPQIINLLKNAKKGEESDTQEITEDDIDFMEQMSQTF